MPHGYYLLNGGVLDLLKTGVRDRDLPRDERLGDGESEYLHSMETSPKVLQNLAHVGQIINVLTYKSL